MADSWMYDGFPLKRADDTTRGDDYQFVIQSLDAALRHTFTFPAGVAITPPFSINESGDVEILQTLSIGSDVPIDEIVDSIPDYAEEEDGGRLANVTAIRAFTSAFIDDYLTTQDLFVLKTGDTMAGPLVANGGITASSELDITKAVFGDNPRLGLGVALQSYGDIDLIQYSAAVVVGDSTESLQLTGAGGRPLYKGESIALVSDIAGSIPGMDYVPEAGGTFAGLVAFDTGLLISSGNPITMEWNAGASSFVLAQVGTDALGDVIFSAADNFEFEGAILAEAFDLNIGARENVLAFSSGEVQVGHASVDINLFGLSIRPLYNGGEIALKSDVAGTYVEGSGITFTDVGGDVDEIAITPAGINVSHFPAGAVGEYLRISSGGPIAWESLDIVAGTGLVVAEDGAKQITVSIDNLGVGNAQLALSSVAQNSMADDAISYLELHADRVLADASPGLYNLIVDVASPGVGTLEWQKGGAAGVLGTVEVLAGSDSCSAEDPDPYEEILAGSTGPYVITKFWYTNLISGRSAEILVVIDGETVLDETINYLTQTIIANDEDAHYDFPFFAKESFSITHRRTGTVGTITGNATALRMA